MLTDTRKSPYAKVLSPAWSEVKWTGGLWKDVEEMLSDSMIPNLKKMFDDKNVSHVIENFKICAGESSEDFDGTVFGDGDFYKWMESALYMAEKTDNKEMLDQLDQYINLFSKAQQEDGYLSTKQIIGEMKQNGVSRMGDINDFEVYNFGHLFTSASLHYRLTGKTNFLQIAEKTAGYLKQLYEKAEKDGEVQTAVCPSHYMGLVELYRTTEKEEYLELAKQAVRLRDSVKDGTDDNQDRIPLKTHRKIVGHAVRSNYLYAGVADLYAEIGDEDYMEVLKSVWEDLVKYKIYITGGCGALYNGASPYGNFFVHHKIHQAYGYEYQLPNITAYAETCANIGLTMWAYRMFEIEPKAEYFDMIERTMLNVNLAAVSLDGKKYFYENMLRRTKGLQFEMVWPMERTAYIESYCCPPNLARVLAQSSEYAYCQSEDAVWLGMYGENRAKFSLENGAVFTMEQHTEYPFNGKIEFTFTEVEEDKKINLNLRIPRWAKKGEILVSGKQVHIIDEKDCETYISVAIDQIRDTVVELNLNMDVQYVVANNMVEESSNQVAVERGPLVYCVESPDFEGNTLDDLVMTPVPDLKPAFCEINGKKMMVLEGNAYRINRQYFDREALYQSYQYEGMEKVALRMVPYYAWDNRGYGEMRIWCPIAYQ